MAGCCQCATGAVTDSPGKEDASTRAWMRMVFAALIAAQSMIFGLAVNLSPPVGTARVVIHLALALSAVLVFVLVGLPILREAWSAARRGRMAMEQLFLAGILGAWFASVHCTLTGYGHVYYEVVAILIAIYTFGKLIGDKRREATLAAARELGAEFQNCEKVGANGSSQTIPAADLRAGDLVRVTAGGGIPVDGFVREGTALVRESALTGEVFPVVKRPGDSVMAGSHTLDQALLLEATVDGSHRLLDDLLQRVRAAQDRPSRLQREADRLVQWFLPAVLVVAIATFIGWTLAEGWMVGTFNALAVLVVACPCSMGLATPVGIWGALGALARRGLIAKDGDLVEKLASIDTVVFDKTGTLGEERLDLIDFVSAAEANRDEVLAAVAILENTSSHPVAMAFRRDGTTGLAEKTELLPGCGIRGWIGRDHWEIGNVHLADLQRNQAESLREQLLADTVGSQEVWVRRNGELAGVGLLRERLREGSMELVNSLEREGIRTVIMTGDREESAARHRFKNLEAGLKPADKAARVKELIEAGHRVLFVGDGTNDAPAMAEATAAFAVTGGSALAGAAASAELPGGNLASISYALQRCRRTVGAIRKNLLFAATYNVIGISLAAAGIIHPVLAAMLMLVSSLTVTWSALREVEEDEEPALVPVRPAPIRRERSWSWSWEQILLPLGVALQGPMLAWLGGFEGATALGLSLIFGTVGLLFFVLLGRRRLSPDAGMALTMFGVGGIGMLTGWWADAGFAQVVREGVCLCGCPKSNLGLGLIMQPTWMAGGMVAASFTGLFYETSAVRSRWGCWLSGLFGMFVGMDGAAALMALVPVSSHTAHLQFFATYSAMMTGMILGMLLACAAYRHFQPARQPQLSL